MTAHPLPSAPVTIALTLDTYRSMNRFAADLVRSQGEARRLLCRGDEPGLELPGRPRGRDRLIAALVESNAGWNNDVAAPLDAWGAGRAISIVGGQQVGLGGGPLYTLAKIASLVALRRRYASEGIDSTLFFWMATEDHDYDEIAALTLPADDRRVTIRPQERPELHRTVGTLPVPRRLAARLGEELQIEPDWLREGITFRDSFAELLTQVLRGHQIVLVDSLLPELRRTGLGLFQQVVDQWESVQQNIRDRESEISAAGYRPQVVATGGEHSLLYWIDEGLRRQAIHRTGDGWILGDDEISREDLLRHISESPERVSTGVLIRPLLQDLALQTDVFVGGPAEVSYYAQITGLYRLTGIGLPFVALRGHALVERSRAIEVFHRFGIDPRRLFDPVDEILAGHEWPVVEELERRAAVLRERLAADLAAIEDLATTADRGLARSIERTERHLRYHVDKLIERSRASIARRDRERWEALSRTLERLAPGGTAQDRIIGWLPYWLQFGDQLLERLIGEIEPDRDSFKLVGL
jgi:bacillithiol synthase